MDGSDDDPRRGKGVNLAWDARDVLRVRYYNATETERRASFSRLATRGPRCRAMVSRARHKVQRARLTILNAEALDMPPPTFEGCMRALGVGVRNPPTIECATASCSAQRLPIGAAHMLA